MSPATLTTTTATTAAPSVVWIPCGTCWGQRRIHVDHNGEGLVAHACPACLGTGEQLVMTGAQR